MTHNAATWALGTSWWGSPSLIPFPTAWGDTQAWPARAVIVAHASSPHSILPRGQGAPHACVVTGPPPRRDAVVTVAALPRNLLLNSHGIAAHSVQAIQAIPGPRGADLVAPLRKHFRGPMNT